MPRDGDQNSCGALDRRRAEEQICSTDESVCIGPPAARDSYMNVAAILSAAEITGADAIIPGSDFLAKTPILRLRVEEHGFTFIGPSAEHIRLMGNKVATKAAAARLGIPIVPGSKGAVRDLASAAAAADVISCTRC